MIGGRFIRSFVWAVHGIALALRTERHMRFHLAAAVVVTAAALILGISRMEWAALVIVMALVLTAEMVNTAIERAVDLTSRDIHPLAKAAKDVSAGAVLVATIGAIVVGIIILGPHLWDAIG